MKHITRTGFESAIVHIQLASTFEFDVTLAIRCANRTI